jgi:hypothetical protein
MQWLDAVQFLVLLLRSDQEALRWLVLPKSSTFIHILSCLTGKGRRLGPEQKQPNWSVESAISYMDEHDISACVLSDPDSANHATGQEARDIARRVNETLAFAPGA